MRFKIEHDNEDNNDLYFFYLQYIDSIFLSIFKELDIANYLNIEFDELYQIYEKHNAQEYPSGLYFNSYQDCEEYIQDLEPYLIMKKLTN